MCIGLWSVEHPDYALILCTNRDEALHRPTQKAQFHSFASNLEDDSLGPILSGRDTKAGGSWFGINTAGRVAFLTNIDEHPPPDGYPTSRGSLVSSFLLSRSTQNGTGSIVQQDSYAGFNLLLMEPVLIETPTLAPTPGGAAGPGTTVAVPASAGAPETNLPGSPSLSSDTPSRTKSTPQIRYNSLFVTNHGGGRPLSSRSLFPSERFCGCMSNGIDGVDMDRWPRIIHAATDFEARLRSFTFSQTSEDAFAEQLFGVLASHPEQPVKSLEDLPESCNAQVAPILLVFDGQSTYYGTRNSTILLVRRDGQVLFIERDIWELGPDGVPSKADQPTDRKFRFKIDLDSCSTYSRLGK